MPHVHQEYVDSSITLAILFSVILVGFLVLAFFTFGNHKHGYCEPHNMYNDTGSEKESNKERFCSNKDRDANEYVDYDKPRQYSKLAMENHKQQIEDEYSNFNDGKNVKQRRQQYDPTKNAEKPKT